MGEPVSTKRWTKLVILYLLYHKTPKIWVHKYYAPTSLEMGETSGPKFLRSQGVTSLRWSHRDPWLYGAPHFGALRGTTDCRSGSVSGPPVDWRLYPLWVRFRQFFERPTVGRWRRLTLFIFNQQQNPLVQNPTKYYFVNWLWSPLDTERSSRCDELSLCYPRYIQSNLINHRSKNFPFFFIHFN